jgi:hypothetical protein
MRNARSRICCRRCTLSTVFTDLITDYAAHGSAADGTQCTAVREYGAADGADTRANCRVLVTRGHAGTTCEDRQHRSDQNNDRGFMDGIHLGTSVSSGLKKYVTSRTALC